MFLLLLPFYVVAFLLVYAIFLILTFLLKNANKHLVNLASLVSIFILSYFAFLLISEGLLFDPGDTLWMSILFIIWPVTVLVFLIRTLQFIFSKRRK